MVIRRIITSTFLPSGANRDLRSSIEILSVTIEYLIAVSPKFFLAPGDLLGLGASLVSRNNAVQESSRDSDSCARLAGLTYQSTRAGRDREPTRRW